MAEPIHAFGLTQGSRALGARLAEQVGVGARDGEKYPHESSCG